MLLSLKCVKNHLLSLASFYSQTDIFIGLRKRLTVIHTVTTGRRKMWSNFLVHAKFSPDISTGEVGSGVLSYFPTFVSQFEKDKIPKSHISKVCVWGGGGTAETAVYRKVTVSFIHCVNLLTQTMVSDQQLWVNMHFAIRLFGYIIGFLIHPIKLISGQK